jgi:chromosome segregation ATPase
MPTGKAAALADLVTVTDVTVAAALETILGAASEAVTLDNAEFLPGLVAQMGERQLGRAVFQVEAPPASRAGSAAPASAAPRHRGRTFEVRRPRPPRLQPFRRLLRLSLLG